jgi:hypothetical protein
METACGDPSRLNTRFCVWRFSWRTNNALHAANNFCLDHKTLIKPIAQHPVASASVKSSGNVTNCRMILIIRITSAVLNTLRAGRWQASHRRLTLRRHSA